MSGSVLFPTSGSAALEPVVRSSSVSIVEDEASRMLSDYCSASSYRDDTWVADKVKPGMNVDPSRRRIRFARIENENLRAEVKRWVLSRLVKGRSPSNLDSTVNGPIRRYADLIPDGCGSFAEAPQEALVAFHASLFSGEQKTSIRYRTGLWRKVELFAKESGFASVYRDMQKFVLEKCPPFVKREAKYIPDEVADRLDVIFMGDDIPLVYRGIYWTLRLIPNRVTEVLSMTPKCVKRLNADTYTLTIPSFKQSGPYVPNDIKLIEVRYEGVGKYLVDLLLAQREEVLAQLGDSAEFLFSSKPYCLVRDTRTGGRRYVACGAVIPKSLYSCNHFFSRLCEYREITDEHGEPYSVTTHQFRHNAISDRMNSGLFRAIDLLPLTAHHNTQMIEQSYTHTSVRDIRGEDPVLFRGRIINTDDPSRFDGILAKPFAKRVHKIGVCSDVRGCGADKSKCLSCKYLVPDVDDLDFYQNELEDWMGKREKARKCGNEVFAELCGSWIGAYEALVQRVLSAVSDEDLELNHERA